MAGKRFFAYGVVVAFAAGGSQTLAAQDASPSSSQTIVLPGVVIAAPAKRNVRKERLRKPEPSGGNTAPLEQQVLEGEKVVRTVRDTTTSVGVVTGSDIADRQIRDLDQAISQTANVIAGTDPNSGFTIRGLNSEGQTGLQHISAVPLIGVVVDGVTQSPDVVRRGARALWDVEQVEVLRGPQSTLQGRNALGGSVFIKTNDPTYNLGGILEGTIGTNGLYGAGFVLNAPIVVGQSAFRISGYKTDRDRDITYTTPANKDMGIDAYDTLRAKFLFEPASVPGLSAVFMVSHTNDEPGSGIVTGPDFFKRRFTNDANFTDFRTGKTDNYSADIGYEILPGMTLRSVTAYAKARTEITTVPGAAFSRDGDRTDTSDFTQDLRLEMTNKGNGLSGVLGLYYGHVLRDNYGNQSAIPDYFYPDNGLPDYAIPYYVGTLASRTTNLAAYADLRYRVGRWSLLAGGRLLRDTVRTEEDAMQLDLGVGYLSFNSTTERTFNEFLPKAGVTYDLAPNQTVGLTYNKGYRTGFDQIIRALAGTVVSTVDPEYVDTFELSYRSNWLNKTLELNANVFYNKYKDQQVVVLSNTYAVEAIYNAASSHSYGAEFEARWRPIPELQVFASLGLLRTKYDEIEYGSNDYSGNKYPESPAYTISAGALYKSRAGWFAGANIRYVDGYYSTGNIANVSTQKVNPYTVVDARVGWEWKNYTLTLFAKNLLDEKYMTSVDRADGGVLAPAYAFLGDERQFGVTLRARF